MSIRLFVDNNFIIFALFLFFSFLFVFCDCVCFVIFYVERVAYYCLDELFQSFCKVNLDLHFNLPWDANGKSVIDSLCVKCQRQKSFPTNRWHNETTIGALRTLPVTKYVGWNLLHVEKIELCNLLVWMVRQCNFFSGWMF